eukprot:CAMPEP_0172727222 /NCGR_PEP_ID=MMETSP1074-20121228/91558_1 /TAXON_ID=2916 /ORGANISM="Ceratium fusus, Strain PA161109" /LENGTH=61 /DNA_ID=CAMNT_0013554347 /DNA_START=79 /DNA_END=260 /DNA_ORIENTATION=-
MTLTQQTEVQQQAGSTPKEADTICSPCKTLTNTAAEAFMQSAAASAMAGVRIGHGGPFGAS